MFKVIEEKNKVLKYNEKFNKILLEQLPEESVNFIGFQGGSIEEKVYYSPLIGLWYTKLDLENRIWNPFGVEDPAKSKNLNIAVEINFPFNLDRQISGVFMEDKEKNIYIGHRGKVNQVKKNTVIENYNGTVCYATDCEQTNKIIVISALEDPKIAWNMKAFAYEIICIKKKCR